MPSAATAIRSCLLAVLVLACQNARQPAGATAPTVTGHVAIAPDTKPTTTKGILVVTWMTADEKQALETGKSTMQLFRDLITRSTIVGEVDAAHEVEFTVHPDRGQIILSAAIDVAHAGIPVILGEGDGALSGMSTPFTVGDSAVAAPTISLTGRPPAPPHERCEGPRLTLEKIEAPEVAGTVGNPTSRRACVRVPASYADHPERRYPVIYALPGLMSTDSAIFASYQLEPEETIVVAVDTSSKTGTTYLVDSPTTGQFDTFFTKDLIPTIDAHYRTLPRREARGVTGHSSGGFNAMSYGLRHPDLIGAIAASSPDGLDFNVWLGEGGTTRPWIVGFQRVEHGLGGAGQFISYAADWSPTQGGYDWPFDASGAVVPSVMKRWIENTPAEWLKDPKRVAAIKPFSGHIYLTVGETDEFDLRPPTVAFSKELTEAGIANELVVTPGGHGTTVVHMAAIAKWFAAQLEAAK